MTRTLYIDAFSGASGDMILGALLDLGLDVEALKTALDTLPISGWALHTTSATRGGLRGVRVHIEDMEPAPHRTYAEIRLILEQSKLPLPVLEDARAIFERLAQAEAKIHDVSIDDVHFHEVGATDSILDIVGCAWCINALDVDQVLYSQLPWSTGMTECQHGQIPLPAPATAELLVGIQVVPAPSGMEWVTPTGAAVLTTLGQQSTSMPEGMLSGVGWGAGQRNPSARPNVLRACLLTHENTPQDVYLLETNIDDASAEEVGFLLQHLRDKEALDVWSTPIVMKKNRLGHQISVLCRADQRQHFVQEIFRQSTTFGVRHRRLNRSVLRRAFKTVQTPYGAVDIKCGYLGNELVTRSPEYDICARLAKQNGVPIRAVFEAAYEALRD